MRILLWSALGHFLPAVARMPRPQHTGYSKPARHYNVDQHAVSNNKVLRGLDPDFVPDLLEGDGGLYPSCFCQLLNHLMEFLLFVEKDNVCKRVVDKLHKHDARVADHCWASKGRIVLRT